MRRVEKQGFYVRPMFEATLAGAELAGQLANKSFEQLRAAQEQYGERLASRGKTIDFYDREQAIGFIRSWLEDNAKQSVVIVDPTFSPEDLIIVQVIRGINSSLRVEIVTQRPATLPQEAVAWDDFYASQWRDISEQSPPPTRITMVGSATASQLPVQRSCLLSGDKGLDLGGSLSSLGRERTPSFSHMELSEVDALHQEMEGVLSGTNDWGGIKVRVFSFNLC